MAELSKLLEDIMGDPDTVQKLRALVDGGQKEQQTEALPAAESALDPAMLLKLTRVMSAMGSSRDDDRTRLLQDLKPYISTGRCKRVDEAVQILRLIKVMDIMGRETD